MNLRSAEVVPQPVTYNSTFGKTSFKSISKHAGRIFSVKLMRSMVRIKAISFFFVVDL